MTQTPTRKHRWGEVLSELAVQQNLLHELLLSEDSRSNSASPRRHLISPSPDPSRLPPPPAEETPASHQHNRVLEADEGTAVGLGTGRAKSEAVTHLIEALSTSSWSSQQSDEDSQDDSVTGTEGARGVVAGGAPLAQEAATAADTERGTRHRFFAGAMRLIDDEYDARQAVVLEEMMNFTEISSVYLLTTFTSSTPQHL